jgi:glycosyltransferase involved in cell wall biosynthesis
MSLTFIIPSVARPSLSKTLECLINQTNNNWKAIVVFDGVSSNIDNVDPRIQLIESKKLGEGRNSAGLVRNYGITFVETEWVAFVDDDDLLSLDYVDIFIKEVTENVGLDIILFRMDRDNVIIPSLQTDTFHYEAVGISFAVKTNLFKEGHIFQPSRTEDFDYLDGARSKSYKIMISPYITYFVGQNGNTANNEKGNRVFINYSAVNSSQRIMNMIRRRIWLTRQFRIMALRKRLRGKLVKRKPTGWLWRK